MSGTTKYGDSSLFNNTGPNNSAFGNYAAYNNTDASCNTAIGSNALFNNTNAPHNTAIGAGAMFYNTTGQLNTAVGSSALEGPVPAASVGNQNVAIGAQALYSNGGDNNVGVGYQSLLNNTTGQKNIAIGSSAGYYLSGSSSYNTFLGTNANVDLSSNTYNYSTALGHNAIIDTSNQIVLGTSNENVKIPGSYVGIGTYNPGGIYALDVSGSVYATTYSTPSDYRIKENVTQLDDTFVVDKLNPVTYLNKKSGKQDIGLIAHELQEIYPELVNGEKDGEQFQSVNYTGLIPILIKEIKELKERVKILEERN
jgi:hypothetical protein